MPLACVQWPFLPDTQVSQLHLIVLFPQHSVSNQLPAIRAQQKVPAACHKHPNLCSEWEPHTECTYFILYVARKHLLFKEHSMVIIKKTRLWTPRQLNGCLKANVWGDNVSLTEAPYPCSNAVVLNFFEQTMYPSHTCLIKYCDCEWMCWCDMYYNCEQYPFNHC